MTELVTKDLEMTELTYIISFASLRVKGRGVAAALACLAR
jgi:hypothetical protein